MPKAELRYRQVHLDFHTSEQIAGIGSAFDPQEFAATLAKARVNSITCFARCHHGWIYYDTQAFPERRHPYLTRNLLAEQIAACHARGIRVPIYVTVQWDQYSAEAHPEWLVIDESGRQPGTPPYEAGFYRRLCVNTPYREFLRAHVQEIIDTLPVDGFFFDIVAPMDCSCRWCRQMMIAEGLEPSDAAARRAFGLRTINAWMDEMSRFVWEQRPDATVFYNAGHVGVERRSAAQAHSHWELESLPSGGWGYMHFPLSQRYARTTGLDCLGMTGKFHTSWGDFHSFKNLAALESECFTMLALNAKVSVGDQLHPDGRIDPYVYDLIGTVFRQVEAKESWCRGARPLVDIGVLSPEEWTGERVPASAAGAVRILQEGGHQFDVLDTGADLSGYRVIILPDAIPCTPAFAARLEDYLAAGGSLIATHRAGLTPAGDAFALDSLGVRLVGEAPYSPDFVLPTGEIGRGLPPTEHAMYLRGLQVEPVAGAEVLADAVVPYFNRTYRRFCSHRHTPSAGKVGYPAVVRRGRAIYFAHPIFAQYNQNAPRWAKRLLLNALDMLLPDPLVRHDGPSTLTTALNEQPAEGRAVLHLLHYVPERRGQDFDVIEDVLPVYGIGVSARVPEGKTLAAVRLAPQGEALPFEIVRGRAEFEVPEVRGHQMVALEYAK